MYLLVLRPHRSHYRPLPPSPHCNLRPPRSIDVFSLRDFGRESIGSYLICARKAAKNLKSSLQRAHINSKSRLEAASSVLRLGFINKRWEWRWDLIVSSNMGTTDRSICLLTSKPWRASLPNLESLFQFISLAEGAGLQAGLRITYYRHPERTELPPLSPEAAQLRLGDYHCSSSA